MSLMRAVKNAADSGGVDHEFEVSPVLESMYESLNHQCVFGYIVTKYCHKYLKTKNEITTETKIGTNSDQENDQKK